MSSNFVRVFYSSKMLEMIFVTNRHYKHTLRKSASPANILMAAKNKSSGSMGLRFDSSNTTHSRAMFCWLQR